MASEEQVRQAMKELGIKEYKNTEKTSPAYKRAEKMLDEAELDKLRTKNNKKGMETKLKQYAKTNQSPTISQQQVTNNVASGKQQDLDNLYPKKQVEAPQAETQKQTKTFADKLRNVSNKISNSKFGKVSGGIGKFLGAGSAIQGGAGIFNPYADDLSRAYDATGILGGVTSLLTGGVGSLATGSGATYNTSKAKEIRDMNKTLMDSEYADLVKSGIDPQVAFNSVYGNIDPKRVGIDITNDRAFQKQYLASTSPDATAATPTQRKISNEKPNNAKVDMKQKMKNEVAKDTQNLPQANGNMEQFIDDQIAKYGGYVPESNGLGQYGQGNIDLYARPQVKNADGSISTVRSMSFNDGRNEVLIPTVSDDGRIMSNEEAIQNYYKTGKYLGKFNTPEEANAYAQQLHNEQDAYYNKSDNQQSVQNTLMPQPTDYVQQIMSMTPQGYVSSQDIMDKLNAAYANINQQINADPRYQGGVVQANNPYNIDEKELAKLQRADQYMNAFGVQSDLAGQYAQQRQVMYEQQMANQLGVPYQDYIDATLDQRKARIANEAQQMENVLTLQAQQATDMKTRLEAINKIQELRDKTATEMYKAELDAQTRKDVALLNAVGGIAKTQAFTNAPSTMFQAAGQYAGSVGGVLGGNYMYSNLWAMTPEQRGMFLNTGRPISDKELQAFFGRMGNVPAQFRTQDGQMPTQPQPQGVLPNIVQWIMSE